MKQPGLIHVVARKARMTVFEMFTRGDDFLWQEK
jgi:hypothetical protein